MEDKVVSALQELRKQEKRKFIQSLDLIINLKNFNTRKDSVNLFLTLPHKIRDARVCGLFNSKSSLVDSVTKPEFDKYKDKKKMKKLVRDYDFFIADISLMPAIATNFGKVLGPVGKMPSPELGILKTGAESEIKETLSKFGNVLRIKSKEPSIKASIGKEDMKDSELAENIKVVYNAVLNALPKKKENIKNVKIKFTMGKPVRLEI